MRQWDITQASEAVGFGWSRQYSSIIEALGNGSLLPRPVVVRCSRGSVIKGLGSGPYYPDKEAIVAVGPGNMQVVFTERRRLGFFPQIKLPPKIF